MFKGEEIFQVLSLCLIKANPERAFEIPQPCIIFIAFFDLHFSRGAAHNGEHRGEHNSFHMSGSGTLGLTVEHSRLHSCVVPVPVLSQAEPSQEIHTLCLV